MKAKISLEKANINKNGESITYKASMKVKRTK